MRQHVLEEQQLAVRFPRQPGREASCFTALVLGLHGLLVALPVLAVGRVRDEIIEAPAGVLVLR